MDITREELEQIIAEFERMRGNLEWAKITEKPDSAVYHPDIDGQIELNRITLTALTQMRDRLYPEPLTLDELKSMEGGPIWYQTETKGYWRILKWYDKLHLLAPDYRRPAFIFEDDDRSREDYALEETYGKWLPYRHKPKED